MIGRLYFASDDFCLRLDYRADVRVIGDCFLLIPYENTSGLADFRLNAPNFLFRVLKAGTAHLRQLQDDIRDLLSVVFGS